MKNKKILIIEDDKIFAQTIYFQLTTSASSNNLVQVSMSIEELDELSEYFYPDVVLLDLNIGQYQGLDTFVAVNTIFPNSAIIILTGTEDQDLALKIVKYGAQDYLVKSEIDNKLLLKSIDYSEERKLQHIKLAESEKKFRNVFLNSPLPMFVVDGMQEEIIMINNSFIHLYGYSSDFLVGKRLSFLNADENEEIEIDLTTESFHNSLIHKTIKGKTLHVELIGNKLSKDSTHYICLVNDRTEEKEFTQKKFRLISSTQENEKKKIAMELHDGLAQNLVLLGLWFNSFDIDSGQESLRENFVNLLNQSLKELKTISYSLLPPELDKGFIKAIKNLVGRINLLDQIHFTFDIDEEIEEDEFKDNDKYNLYRIIQETVNNSLKHSKAKNLIISIKKSDKHIILSLKDDGIGFEQDKVSGSLGMQNLNYRMNIGNLSGSIESAPSEGTKLILHLVRDFEN